MQGTSLSPEAVVYFPTSGNADSPLYSPISQVHWAPPSRGQFVGVQPHHRHHQHHQKPQQPQMSRNELVPVDARGTPFMNPSGPSFELVDSSSMYVPASPSSNPYRPSQPYRMTSPPYGFNHDLSAASPNRPSTWMSPTATPDGRNSANYPAPFPSFSYSYSYEMPRLDNSIISPGSASTSPAQCPFAPKLELVKERKLHRRKSIGTSDLKKVSVGVQYEKEEQRRDLTKKIVLRDREVQTDFSDDVAQLLLVERPSSFYQYGSLEAASLDVEAGSSVNSDDLDSDSGYSSWRHRALLADCCCAASESSTTVHQLQEQRDYAATATTSTGWYCQHQMDGSPYQTAHVVDRRHPLPPQLRYVPFALPPAGCDASRPRPASGVDTDGDWRRSVGEASGAVDAGTATHDVHTTSNLEHCEAYDRRHLKPTSATSATAAASWSNVNSKASTAGCRVNRQRKTVPNSSYVKYQPPAAMASVDKRLDGKTAKKNRRREIQLTRAADNERLLIDREQKALVEECSVNRTASLSQEFKQQNDKHPVVTRDETSVVTSSGDLYELPSSLPSLVSSTDVGGVASAAVAGTTEMSSSDVIPKLHGKYVREYCDHIISAEIDDCCLQLLQSLSCGQQSSSSGDVPECQGRPTSKRRLVVGLREVPKQLRSKQLKCVVIAPNIEMIHSQGGLDDAILNIIRSCNEHSVPVVFALGRKALGRACAKSVPVSVVGVFNCDGVEEVFQRLLELTGSAREKYAQIKLNFSEQMALCDGRRNHQSETATTMSASGTAQLHRDVHLLVENDVANQLIVEPTIDNCQLLQHDNWTEDPRRDTTTTSTTSSSNIEIQSVDDLQSTVDGKPSEADMIDSLEPTNERHNFRRLDGRENDREPEVSFELRYAKLTNDDTVVDGNRCGDAVVMQSLTLSNGYIDTCQQHAKTHQSPARCDSRPDDHDGPQERTTTRCFDENETDFRYQLTNGGHSGEDESMTAGESADVDRRSTVSAVGYGFTESVGPRHEKQLWHETGCIRGGASGGAGGNSWTHGEPELVADSVC